MSANVYATVLAFLIFSSLASATIIADLKGDFQPVTFPTGWQYLRNTGPIGDNSNYTPLLWDVTNVRYDRNGLSWPATVPGNDYTFLNKNGGFHPGPKTLSGVTLSRYLITAYTIQPGEEGFISLVNGAIWSANTSGGPSSDGWDIRTFVGNTEIGTQMIFPWTSSSVGFQRDLGVLDVGDTVFVAVGPNIASGSDQGFVQFKLDSRPVSESGNTLIFITAATGGLVFVRKRRRA